ncbi:hypothetical protein K7X08_019332 [Anisodus acutangulus]|uniref:Uncharacterized protein n=1 Tax=Anisodus acutangulus TaxID=402998 RepID=A0A9Q1MSB8_9SOLA|nr:hypothetical protein K7X08_019332 [Anisodus acutangulus]
MSAESTIKMRHDSDVSKSAKRKEVVQTPSKFKASVSNTEKRRKVVHAASVSKHKNVDADTSGSEPKNDAAEEPSKSVLVKSQILDCGMYVAAFSEYLSLGEGISDEEFNVELLRTRYGTLLWDYINQKIKLEAVSNDEAPVRPMMDFDQVEKS